MKQIEKVFRERFMPLYPRLYSIASAILGNTSGEAADAVQETMVKIWRSGAAMSTVEEPEAYAVTMLRNTAVDMRRKRRYDEPADEVREMASDPPPDPDTVDFLERIIDTLPPGQVEVIRLSAFGELSNDEISAVTGLSASNVRQLLSRGRKRIKELYTKYM